MKIEKTDNFPGELGEILTNTVGGLEEEIKNKQLRLRFYKRVQKALGSPNGKLIVPLECFELHLSSQAIKGLKKSGVENLDSIVGMSQSQWEMIEGFSPKIFQEIRDMLRKFGFNVKTY